MTAALGRWRATYTPGEWVVLSGPSSLVLLEPPTHEWASLVNTLWDEVVASSSITDLAARLAHGLHEQVRRGEVAEHPRTVASPGERVGEIGTDEVNDADRLQEGDHLG